MVESHSKSFFGQNTGIIITSSSSFEPFIFIRCLKKKPDGNWEKLSANEGQTIKCSLEEIVMILQVLYRRKLNWQSFHLYQDKKTSLSFKWEDEHSETLWINIGNYSKMLNFAQTEILKLLLSHLLKEKVIYATTSKKKEINYDNVNNGYELEFNSESSLGKNFKLKSNTLSQNIISKDLTNIEGKISGETDKAILINFFPAKEVWIPKSSIHSQYIPRKSITQTFLIDNWILEKNKIIP